jgi:hypothetical protein
MNIFWMVTNLALWIVVLLLAFVLWGALRALALLRWRLEELEAITPSVLAAASRMFRSVGFEKVEQRRSKRWGVAVIEEWYVLHPFGRRHPSPNELASS